MYQESASSNRYFPGRERLPILQTGVVQLGRGAARFEVWILSGRDALVVRQRVAPKLAGYVVPHPDWLVLFVPLRWSSEFVFNGAPAEPGIAFLSVSPNGYSTSGSDRDTLAIGVRKSRVLGECSAYAGVDLDDLSVQDTVLHARTHAGLRIGDLVIRILRHSQAGSAPGVFLLSEADELRLISAVASALSPLAVRKANTSRNSAPPLRIVRLAEEALRNSDGRLVSLADLCRAAGVSKAWLHRCFHEIYGISPVRFIKLWRMTAARDALLDRGADTDLVKQAALRFGFMYSGRFADEYRSLFGEYPSETMQRTRSGDDLAIGPWPS